MGVKNLRNLMRLLRCKRLRIVLFGALLEGIKKRNDPTEIKTASDQLDG